MKANSMKNGEFLRPEPKKRFTIKTNDKHNTVVLTNSEDTCEKARERGYQVFENKN